MQRDRAVGGSKSEIGRLVDRRRINDVLDKHLQRVSPSSSKGGNGKEKERASSSAQSIGKTTVAAAAAAAAQQNRKGGSNSINGFAEAEEESDTDHEDSYVSGSDVEDDVSWISWFCNSRGNEFFCEVDEDYIEDDFNMCGLKSQVAHYDYALDLILDYEWGHAGLTADDLLTEEQQEAVETSAETLYGLIHARYILTSIGLNVMLEKFKNCDFGRCPRVFCSGQRCLPVGQIDIPKSSTVKIYCPKCEDIYYPRSKYQDVDGAFFGTTFPHLFLMTYGHLRPQKPSQSYVPRIFGYKVHKQ